MHKRYRNLLTLGLLGLALAGCASTGNGWNGLIGEEPPPVGDADQVIWADLRNQWQPRAKLVGSGELLGPGDLALEAWTFEKGTLALRLKAAEQLNEFRGTPHALLVHIYQVSDPHGLQAFFDGSSGLRRLLTSQELDPSVLGLQKVIVQPGSSRLLQLDRAMLARYVVIVAGYSELDVAASTRVLPIPGVRDYPKGGERYLPGNLMNTLNPWAEPPPARPGRLQLWVDLGPDKIEKLEVRAR